MKFLQNLFKNEPVSFLLRRYWKFAEGHRKMFVFSTLLSAFSNTFLALEPLIAAALINEIQQNGFGAHNINHLIFISSWIVWLIFFYLTTRWIADYMLFMSALYANINARKFLLKGILNLGLSWHAEHESGDVIDKINKSASAVAGSVKTFKKFLRTSVKFVTAFLAVAYFNFFVAVVAFFFVVGIFYTVTIFDRYLIPLYKKANNIENKVVAKIFDTISNVTTVVILNVQKAVFTDIDKVMQTAVPVEKKKLATMENKWWWASFAFHVVVFGVLASYLYFALHSGKVVAAGSVAALFMYLLKLGDSFFESIMLYSDIVSLKANIENSSGIEKDFSVAENTIVHIPQDWKNIKLRKLYFKYPNTEEESAHLNVQEYEFARGEKIAIIGESGSGKTTFLKVLHGMYPDATADIYFDSKKVNTSHLSEVDMKTMLVPQEPELFSASIKENITLGLDYSKKDIEHVSELSAFAQVLPSLPNGYDSVVNEKGVNLSGGQKQRLALARALLFAKDKSIILLDESTSSVDPTNEIRIYKNIFNEFAGKTIIASIHKMNLLKYFDRIVIFENGKLADEGTFDELLKSNNKFKKDWEEYIKEV